MLPTSLKPRKARSSVPRKSQDVLEKQPVSDVSDKSGLNPSVFYHWRKEFFENGTASVPFHKCRMAIQRVPMPEQTCFEMARSLVTLKGICTIHTEPAHAPVFSPGRTALFVSHARGYLIFSLVLASLSPFFKRRYGLLHKKIGEMG
jgi:hypothetical protein